MPGSATDWIRDAVLTMSPATMPSPSAPSVDGGLAGEDAGSGLEVVGAELVAERGDGFDELEGGANGALGVVLRGRSACPRRP